MATMFPSDDMGPILSVILHLYSGKNAHAIALQSQIVTAPANGGELWTSQQTQTYK